MSADPAQSRSSSPFRRILLYGVGALIIGAILYAGVGAFSGPDAGTVDLVTASAGDDGVVVARNGTGTAESMTVTVSRNNQTLFSKSYEKEATSPHGMYLSDLRTGDRLRVYAVTDSEKSLVAEFKYARPFNIDSTVPLKEVIVTEEYSV